MVVTIVTFVVSLSILIIGHELGHFIIARRSGVTVEEFGLGYPPRLFTLANRGGVLYTINVIPLGGFVRMRGEDEDAGEGSFLRASPKSKLAVLLAGPAASALVAVVFLALAFLSPHPVVVDKGVRIQKVAPSSPAEQAGLKPDDIIIAFGGNPVRNIEDLRRYTKEHQGETVPLTVKRGSETVNLEALVRTNPPAGQGAMGIVITSVTEMKSEPIWSAIWDGIMVTLRLFVITLLLPILLAKGALPLSAARPIGPVSIARITGVAMSASLATGYFYHIFYIVGFISAALSVTNLLPLPALDGGRAAFALLELIRGKPVDPHKEAWVHFVGMGFLLFLMVLITYVDIVSPIDLSKLGY